MKENSKLVLKYVQAHDGEQMTANTIADALGLGVRQVVGSINAYAKAIEGEKARPAYFTRVPGQETKADGTVKGVNFIELTPEGREVDVDAAE